MTRIGKTAVRRETAATYSGRALVMELHPRHVVVRPKGLRGATVTVSYEAVYELGWKLYEASSRQVSAIGNQPGRKR